MNSSKKTKHLLSILSLILFLFLAIATMDDDSSGGSQPSSVDLNAEVRFTGNQFVITNNDSFDWTNVELDLNPGTFSSGYTLNHSRLSAGETYTVGAMQFANSDGEKFNPFTHKPQKFNIIADTPNGRGYYFGSWN